MSAAQHGAGASLPTRALDAFSVFMDTVATLVAETMGRLSRAPMLEIREGADGRLAMAGMPPFRLDAGGPPPDVASAIAGRTVELVLDPGRFVFRTLELPRGATAFLDGIVRAQIDRLTPWSAQDAAFGWAAPEPAAEERIALLVAATARARLAGPVAALRALGARSVRVSTLPPGPEEGAGRIRVLNDAAAAPAGTARIRQGLLGGLAGAAVLATLALFAGEIAGARLDAGREEIEAQIAARRRVLAAGREGQGREGAAVRALEQRKREVPSGVLVLEALSRVLPDDTFLSEMQMDADRVQITGVSADAPALIGLLERSRAFSEATFVAPTTRQPGESGERFHIEARIALPMEVLP